jgi:RimJ/RimL family protein N-acetyltransferase
MPGAVYAAGDAVALHTVEEEDAEFIRDFSNRPAVREPMTLDGPRNLEQTREHVSGDTDDFVQFLVCVHDDDAGVNPAYVARGEDAPAGIDAVEPVGLVMLFGIDAREGTTSFAYWLVPGVHGRGYATEATALTLDYAFGHRRMHRVNARVLDSNAASIGLLEKLGFEHEGTQREEKLVAGDRVDTRIYGLLAEEWDEVRKGLDVPLTAARGERAP